MSLYVELLPLSTYHGPINPQPSLTGQFGLTHLAALSIGGKVRHCYVKTYGDDVLRLAHEIAGYCLARCAGLRTPSYCGVIALPTTLFNTIHGRSFLPNTYQLAWVTTDLADGTKSSGQIAKIAFNAHIQTRELIDDLIKWQQLPTLLAVDEWMANVDRNLGNLFRHGVGDYSVFDHGELLSGGGWCPAGKEHDLPYALVWNATYCNKILGYLRENNGLTLPVKSAMLNKARELPAVYTEAYQQFVYFWTQLLNSSYFAAATTFLEVRAQKADTTLPHRIGMIV